MAISSVAYNSHPQFALMEEKAPALAAENLRMEDIFVPVSTHFLHIKRIYKNPKGQPIILLHGANSNHTTFINKKGDKGLASYLAQHGYDIFLFNLRGHGKGYPKIDRTSLFGLKENISEDCPALMGRVREIKGDVPQHWMAHSWGGVLLLAYFARYHTVPKVSSMTFFATRRQSTIFNLEKVVLVDILFRHIAGVVGKILGYLPMKKFGLLENETSKFHREIVDWLNQSEWQDWDDAFDYGKALREASLPPIFSLTGGKDLNLGHPKDVKLLLKTIGVGKASFQRVGIQEGYREDYTHSTILTAPHAPLDHFPKVLSFLKSHSQSADACAGI